MHNIVHNVFMHVYMYVYMYGYLEPAKQFEMLHHSESVKQYIVLGTDSETLSDLVHVVPDVITIDDCCTSSWCVKT